MITIEDIAPFGEEMPEDQLDRVFGGREPDVQVCIDPVRKTYDVVVN